MANATIPTSGRAPPPPTEAASSVPTNGPTQANDASENVSPISSVPAKPPLPEDRVQPRQDGGGNGDLEGPQQAQAEGHEQRRDEAIHPGIRAKLHHAERTQDGRGGEAQPGEQHHDPQAEHHRLRHAIRRARSRPAPG